MAMDSCLLQDVAVDGFQTFIFRGAEMVGKMGHLFGRGLGDGIPSDGRNAFRCTIGRQLGFLIFRFSFVRI
jgi:hypothetical protein